jgi:hypothetical protein
MRRTDRAARAWSTAEQVRLATLHYVDWFNRQCVFEACGDIPPAELEAGHYRHNAARASGRVVAAWRGRWCAQAWARARSRRAGRQVRRWRCGVVPARRAALARSRSWRARRCRPTSACHGAGRDRGWRRCRGGCTWRSPVRCRPDRDVLAVHRQAAGRAGTIRNGHRRPTGCYGGWPGRGRPWLVGGWGQPMGPPGRRCTRQGWPARSRLARVTGGGGWPDLDNLDSAPGRRCAGLPPAGRGLRRGC